MFEKAVRPLQGRLIFALLYLHGTCVILTESAAFPDWTDCPAVCHCKWTSGKKSAFCPDAGLTSLPASLDPEMQVLDLSGNQIPALQSEIFKRAGLVNLQKVFLRNAGIHEIHADAFKDMRILVEVDLSDNHVEILESGTFLGNERLRILTLSGNPLTVLKSHQFPPLGHLRNLELQRCALTEIHGLAFAKLVGLELLKLDGNELSYLEARTLSTLPSLKTLTLDNNKWFCDCRLKGFRSWLIPETPRKLYSTSQICTGPSRLQGRRWEDVEPTEFACSPQVKLYTSTIQEEVNGNLSLSCLVSGDPEPELWWQLNGGPLNLTRLEQQKQQSAGNNYIITITSPPDTTGRDRRNDPLSEHNLVEKWSNITIYNASDSDAGEYVCHGKNIAGVSYDTVNIVVPRVFTAPTLSQTDNWLLWVSLVGGGATVLCALISAVFLSICFCSSSRRRRRREKVKLQGSTSFGDQEKKLLDLSVTTTTGGNTNDRTSGHGSLADTSCSPGDLELAERASICDAAATVTVERLRPDCGISSTLRSVNCPTGFPPPPPEFTGGVLPSGIFGNIFISVSMPQDSDRCYPDLLDIPVHAPSIIDKCNVSNSLPSNSIISTFATLPRRTLRTDSGSQYDNMGPRVTATGSSTFSLTDDLRLSPPPPPRLIKPPIEFVSL